MPQQRRSLEELYGATAPTSPSPRRSLEDLYQSTTTEEEPASVGGWLDGLKNMSGREWAGTAMRLGGGYLAGIPAMVPGVGTLVGGAIGGGSELLAQLIEGRDDLSPGGIAVGAGVGMIPGGKLFKAAGTAGSMARAPLSRRLASAVTDTTNLSNAARGAGLNVAAAGSQRFSDTGEVPFMDYSPRELSLPAAIGAGGGAGASVIGKWMLERGGGGRPGAPTTPGASADLDGQGALNFDAPAAVGGGVSRDTLSRARAALTDPDAIAAFDHMYGPVGTAGAPRNPRPPAPPSALGLPDKLFPSGMKTDAYASRLFGDFQTPVSPDEPNVGSLIERRGGDVGAGRTMRRRSLEDIYYQDKMADIDQGTRSIERIPRGPMPPDEPLSPPAEIVARMLGQEQVEALPWQSGGGRAPRGPMPTDDAALPVSVGGGSLEDVVPSNLRGGYQNPVKQTGFRQYRGEPQGDEIDELMGQLGLQDDAATLTPRAPASAELMDPGYAAFPTPEDVRYVVDPQSRAVQAVTPDGVVIGQARFDDSIPGQIKLEGIEVNPNHQRQGIGTRLMETLRETFPGAQLDRGALASEAGQGFRAATSQQGDLGASNPMAFRSEPLPGPQPVLPGSSASPGADMLTPPGAAVPRGTVMDSGPVAEPGRAAFYMPRQVRELYEELKPLWEADLARQQASGEPIVNDPTMSLEDFATQTMFETDPRRLMGRQRKIRKALDDMDPSTLEMVDVQGRPMVLPDEPVREAPDAVEQVRAMLEGPTAPVPPSAPSPRTTTPQTTAGKTTAGFVPRPSLAKRADELIQEFIAAAGEPPADADGLYWRADAYRQAQDAALDRLRAEIPPSTPFKKLPIDLQAELRRIYEEMDTLRFVGRSFDYPPGQGGTPDVKAGAAGAPVYHDIMEGRGGSRGSVLNAIDKYINGKKPSPIASRSVDVALRRLAGRGSQSLSAPKLPPDAGYGGEGVPLGPEMQRPGPGSTPDDWGGDTGAVDPKALYTLASAGTGALLGPVIDKEGANPWLSAAGGGLTGAILATAARNPALLERIQSSSLFSNMAPLTSAIGNVGGLAAFALEHPQSAAAVARETFDPQTVEAMKRAFKSGVVRENVDSFADEPMSPLSIPGRLIGAPDAATRDIVQRAMVSSGEATGQGALPGFPNREVAELGGRYTLSGDPRSEFGKSTLDYLSKNRLLRTTVAPVARTPINWLETGMERLPGVGMLPNVQAMDPDAAMLTRALRQLYGAGAIGAGAAVGSALQDSEYNDYLPLIGAAAGPFGLPLAAGATMAQLPEGRRKNEGGLDEILAVLENIKRQIPLIGQTYFSPAELLKRFVPYGGAGRLVNKEVIGLDPRDLDASVSYFGPAMSQIPVANEAFLPPKRKPQR